MIETASRLVRLAAALAFAPDDVTMRVTLRRDGRRDCYAYR